MEKPILFNTEMVKAILEGRKACTRRIVKPQPVPCNHEIYKGDKWKNEPSKWIIADEGYAYCGLCGNGINFNGKGYLKTPYKVGDILYVRETWTTIENFKNYADVEMDKNIKYLYKCDDNGKEHAFIDVGVKKWKPSIHMPKIAARIFLKVTDVRVEKLQGLDYQGALSEGIVRYDGWISEFKELWDSTLKKEQLDLYSWNSNPWVWVIEFERVERVNKHE